MSVLSIRTVPDPVLRSQTTPIPASRFGTPGLRRLIDSMYETMDDVQGVGLAGPQVGVGQAVFVFDLDGRRGHVINPALEVWGELAHEPAEGCLSVPEIFYAPPRSAGAKVTGFDVEGTAVSYEGTGLFARMLQHEVDHLKGFLFVDRLVGDTFRAARRAMASAEFRNTTQRINTERAARTSSAFGSAFGSSTTGERV